MNHEHYKKLFDVYQEHPFKKAIEYLPEPQKRVVKVAKISKDIGRELTNGIFWESLPGLGRGWLAGEAFNEVIGDRGEIQTVGITPLSSPTQVFMT